MEKIVIYTDGGARGNPGPAGIGAVILDEQGNVLKEISKYVGEQTNNFAEYEALITALHAVKEMFGASVSEKKIEVRMDSELVVRQIGGIYKVKEPTLKEKHAQVVSMRQKELPNIMFTHVRREKNKHADRLVNQAIDAHVSQG